MKKCPYCAESIQIEAIKCKHCGEWLEKKSNNSKSTFSSSLENTITLIKKKNNERLLKRYEHLYEPTDDQPLVITDLKLHNNYVECIEKFSYDDIPFIEYSAESNSAYGIPMASKIKAFIYFSRNKKIFELDQFDATMKFNHQKSFGILGVKRHETINYIIAYVRKRTLNNRLQNYLNYIQENGFIFAGNYKIFNNGDIKNFNDEFEINFIEAYNKDLVDYGSEWWGNVTTTNPYVLDIYKSGKPVMKIAGMSLRNKISIFNNVNQDVIDIFLQKLLNDGKII